MELINSQLTTLPPVIGSLEGLERLWIDHNPLIDLPVEIGNLTNLEDLRLSATDVTSLPESIGNLSQLKFLDLSSSNLEFLADSIGKLSSLERLDLAGTNLEQLPNSISGLESLVELELQNSALQSLPEQLGELSRLEELDISNTPLQILPSSVGALSSLVSLRARGANLIELPPSIVGLISLRGLYLSENQLLELPEEIGQLSSLRVLEIAGNDLRELPDSIGQLAFIDSELFTESSPSEWIRLSTDGPLGTLQLSGGSDYLDGSAFLRYTDQLLYFLPLSEVGDSGDQARKELGLINPHPEPIRVQMRKISFDEESDPSQFIEQDLSPNSSYRIFLNDTFPGLTTGDYIIMEVLVGPGVAASGWGQIGEDDSLVNLTPFASPTGFLLFAPHVAWLSSFDTRLRLLNVWQGERVVSITVRNDQTQKTVSRVLPAGSVLDERLTGLFPEIEDFDGGLLVQSNGPGIAGDVLLHDTEFRTANLYPLIDILRETFVFSQVANTSDFFTGLALYNPGEEAAEVRIEVYDAAGQQVGIAERSLGAGEPLARLIEELIPETAGQIRGHIRLFSSLPLAAVQIFGDREQTLLALVPAQ